MPAMDLKADTMVDELFSQVNENEWSLLSKRNDEIGSSSLLPHVHVSIVYMYIM